MTRVRLRSSTLKHSFDFSLNNPLVTISKNTILKTQTAFSDRGNCFLHKAPKIRKRKRKLFYCEFNLLNYQRKILLKQYTSKNLNLNLAKIKNA